MKIFKRRRGMSLPELMVAMVFVVILVGGAMTVFVTTSTSRRVNDDIARLQENGRFAMDVLTPDIRTTGLWGLTNIAGLVQGAKGGTGQLAALPQPAGGDCENRWYIDVFNTIQGFNDHNPYDNNNVNTPFTGNDPSDPVADPETCIPAADYLNGTDVLVLRHVDPTAATALTAGLMYVRSDSSVAQIFEGSTPPLTVFAPGAEDHRLISHAYYVRPYTVAPGDGLPSLRRKFITASGTDTIIDDEEIIPGVEDFQIQFGVDDNGNGSINSYLNPNSAALTPANIKAVRIWLMVRTSGIDREFTDTATYTYASKSVTPGDNFRRLLISSTVRLRNHN